MNRAAAKAEFTRITEDGLQALDRRMNIYLQSLNGAAGMMQSSENIEYDDFETFVESLDFENYLPGINGIGFVEPVAKVDEDAFVADMRANGTPGFEIRPETNHDQKYVIKYIAPVLPNKEAVGLDISFEKGRREAADRARETNTPQLTPRILLVQDAMKEPGFLLLRPLFYASGPREGTFRGWVYAPFIGRNLLQDLTPNQNNVYDFHVYDGDTTDPDFGTGLYEDDNYHSWDIALSETWGPPYDATSKLWDMTHGYLSGWCSMEADAPAVSNMSTMDYATFAKKVRGLSNIEDATQREGNYTEIFQTLHDEAIFLPLTAKRQTAVTSASVTNFEFGYMQYDLPLANLCPTGGE